MPVLDPKVATYRLEVNPSIQPIKQAQYSFHLDIVVKIELEIDKLKATNFICEMKYPPRLVEKKMEKFIIV